MKLRKKPDMVNALILDKNDHALLIHNIKNGQDRWEFPGGKAKEEDKNLEEAVIREIEEKIGCKIKIVRKDGKKIFGDYETTTLEGVFLCRIYFTKIIEGTPEIMERGQEKADYLDYSSYDGLLILQERGTLAPNLVLALPKLKSYME